MSHPNTPLRAAYLLLGASALGAPQPGLANDDQETHPAKTKMEQVVVTANRAEKPLSTIPNTVTVIDDDELDQQININPDLSTILGNMIPSFAPSRQKLTGYGETLRGRDPLYLVDGVPQSNPLRDGSRDGYTIDPLMLERVEVLHGANAIHGMGASGGIINLITKSRRRHLSSHFGWKPFSRNKAWMKVLATASTMAYPVQPEPSMV